MSDVNVNVLDTVTVYNCKINIINIYWIWIWIMDDEKKIIYTGSGSWMMHGEIVFTYFVFDIV